MVLWGRRSDKGSPEWKWEVRVGESHRAAVPGNVVGGLLMVELYEVDDNECQQPGQGHIAPQEGEG